MNIGIRILIADEETGLRALLADLLTKDGHKVTETSSGEDALESFKRENYPLVISDLMIAGMEGTDLMKQVRKLNPDTQFIFISGHASLNSAISAVRLGAYDYLTKPFDDIELVSTVVNRAVEKIRLIEEKKALIVDLERKNAQLVLANEVLKEMASRDYLTGLFNHRYLHEALSAEVRRSSRYKRKFAVMMIDVDYFKNFNDSNGHPEGDELLRSIAKIFMDEVRNSDVVARYGGEEFVVILTETDKDSAVLVAEKIRKQIEGNNFKGSESQPSGKVTVSIGVAEFPDNGENPSALLRFADGAMYRAKERGRNLVCS
jgi:diguanylate cyclase (GGDEF)-like protein